jgi:pimeloyl-ACP methyl ester carboxylesterase
MTTISRLTALRVVRAAILLIVLGVPLHAQGKNPVILIPGLSGSELRHKVSGDRVWFKTFKSSSEDLRLPIAVDIVSIHDDLIPGDVLRKIKIGPFPVTDVYDDFIDAMRARGGYTEEKWDAPSEDGAEDSLYVFPYDWRLDNVVNARRLVKSVADLKARLKKPDLKFDIVAHSMGGIIARYAAMYGDVELPAGNAKPKPTWAGARYFDKIILIGTPHNGTPMALSTLVNGFTLGGIRIDLPFVEDSSKFTAFTIPTAYQLLPAPGTLRAFDDRLETVDIDLYDPKVWTKYGWNPIDDRDFADEFKLAERKIAPAYFAASLARAKRLHEAIDVAGKGPGVTFHAVGSDCKTAPDAILIYQNSEKWKTAFRPKGFTRRDGVKITDDELKKIMLGPGDEVVTRRSLEGAEVDSTKFICGEHNKLAANTMIQDYVIGLLTGKTVPQKPGVIARN